MKVRNDGYTHFSKLEIAGTPEDSGNGLQINPALAGSAPAVTAVGDDTNIDLSLTPKGTGSVQATGEGGIRFAAVTVSSAELLALRATPKTLVAAQGASKLVEFVSAIVIADNAVAYVVGAADFAIRYKDGSGDIISQTIDSAGLLDQTTDIMTQVIPIATDSKTPKADCENQPLVLHNTGAGEWTTGTGVLRMKVSYRVWTTGW